MLSELRLDRCKRITDAAFDSNQSLFEPLVGCLSLESISLQVFRVLFFIYQMYDIFLMYSVYTYIKQNCPQLTGSVVVTLNKNCQRLKYLNLSQVR